MSYDRILNDFLNELTSFKNKQQISKELFPISFFQEKLAVQELQQYPSLFCLPEKIVSMVNQMQGDFALLEIQEKKLNELRAKKQTIEQEKNPILQKIKALEKIKNPSPSFKGNNADLERKQFKEAQNKIKKLNKNLETLKEKLDILDNEMEEQKLLIEPEKQKRAKYMNQQQEIATYLQSALPKFVNAIYARKPQEMIKDTKTKMNAFLKERKTIKGKKIIIIQESLASLGELAIGQEKITQRELEKLLSEIIQEKQLNEMEEVTDALRGLCMNDAPSNQSEHEKVQKAITLAQKKYQFDTLFQGHEATISQRVEKEQQMAKTSEPKAFKIKDASGKEEFTAVIDFNSLEKRGTAVLTLAKIKQAIQNGICKAKGEAGFKPDETSNRFHLKWLGQGGNSRLFGKYDDKSKVWTADKAITTNAHRKSAYS